MKKFLNAALAVILAVIMAIIGPVNVLAADNAPAKTYISEVKIGMGDSAKADLEAEGFTVLCDEQGEPIDLNQGAGGGAGSQGNKKVLLGYKTTNDITKAVTDLALMNMEGGYSVPEYKILMDRYANAQISPFIDKFIVAINEYRENINSADDVNRARAQYVRAALNKFTDDDCGGAGLGDLLLNETVYEMAKPVYDAQTTEQKEEKGIAAVNAEVRDALPAAEKNQHCDILTLFAQADGQIMLVIYSLITRAADTSDDSWIDRFVGMTYDDLLDSYDMAPTDAKKQAAKDFEDDAKILLKNWDDFRTLLIGADDAVETINAAEMPDVDNVMAKVTATNDDSSDEELLDAALNILITQAQTTELIELATAITISDYLESIEYGDGTLYDFFARSASEVADDITSLYPIVAALSPGQRAGIEFLSIREFVMLGNREAEYDDEITDDLPSTSVYEGVDRGIYEKGGVALTSDALRSQALEKQRNRADESWISTKTVVLYAVTGACILGFIGSVTSTIIQSVRLFKTTLKYEQLQNATKGSIYMNGYAVTEIPAIEGISPTGTVWTNKFSVGGVDYTAKEVLDAENTTRESLERLTAQTSVAKWMSAGFAAATVVMSAVSVYMSWQDLKAYYKVDFTPIPKYMVDEASITYLNERNEKMVKENHAAYYEAVTCNRKESDKNFETLNNRADMNGDVGQQWLALYACRDYKEMQPILADSLKVVVGSNDLPATYDNRGIHMFGSDSAFNLNSKLYDWNQNAKSVFVYFKVDTAVTPSETATSASSFSAGWIALIGVGCAGLGAVITAVAMTVYGKKKKNAAKV